MKSSGRQIVRVSMVAIAAWSLLGGPATYAATKSVDLDGNGTAESTVELNVLATYPAKIENKVTNKTAGNTYTFNYFSAGPGGFSSSLAAGTSTGVGTKWTWQTGSTIYSYTGTTCPKDICFTLTKGSGKAAPGPFGVPGRSLTPSDITVSAASLTSSLISFFSPPKIVFQVTSTAGPGGFQETLSNPSTSPATVTTEAYPPGCCPANPSVPHQLNCAGVCVDYLNDPYNCGACGNVCGDGTCCTNGNCVSLCPTGRTWCDGLCYDLQNDPGNCGACGNVCDAQSICTGGACVPCDGKAGAKDACDNRCVNLNTDPYNCGSCGHVCNLDCPSNFTGVCSSGNSCHCVEGTPAPPPPSNIPPPVPPIACPNPGPPAPNVVEAPVCIIDSETQTIPPGGSVTICRGAGTLYKEAPGTISLCSDYIPAQPGNCASGEEYAQGTYVRLVPAGVTPGLAYLTPYAVHVTSDTSGDGLIQPGETASLVIAVLNAGSTALEGATAKLSSPPVDLTDDGVNNPVGMTFLADTATYGSIPGTPAAADCAAGTLYPVSNTLPFQISVPAAQPGDATRPFTLTFQGKVNGSPATIPMNLALGIAGKCDPAVDKGDYDGVDGLISPMAKLVPEGDDPPFPAKPFTAGKTRPLKLRLLCGGVNLTGSDVEAPQIVGLSEATRGVLDISNLNLNDDAPNPNDPYFRYNTSTKQWIYNMRTSQIGLGTFTLKIRIAGRKDYVSGFVLN